MPLAACDFSYLAARKTASRLPGGLLQEGTMHIHGNLMNVNAANLYSAAQGERATVAERAAEVRKRLLKSATGLDAGASPEETLLIGQWMDGRHSQVLSGDEYHAVASGKDPDFG